MRQTMFNGNFMTKLRQSNAGHQQTMNGFNGQVPAHGQQYENMNHHMMNQDRDGGSSFGTTASGVGNHRIGTTNGSAASNQAHLFNLVN